MDVPSFSYVRAANFASTAAAKRHIQRRALDILFKEV